LLCHDWFADTSLPEFLVPLPVYEAGQRHGWLPGDRLNMCYFGAHGSSGGKGQQQKLPKGTVMSVEDALHGEQYDPWESITVLWDHTHGDDDDDGTQHKVGTT
jgi:hypothetical protein